MSEDGKDDQYIRFLDADGQVQDFARNALSESELAGVCFSPDGRALFINIHKDHRTYMITGPFPEVPKGLAFQWMRQALVVVRSVAKRQFWHHSPHSRFAGLPVRRRPSKSRGCLRFLGLAVFLRVGRRLHRGFGEYTMQAIRGLLATLIFLSGTSLIGCTKDEATCKAIDLDGDGSCETA